MAGYIGSKASVVSSGAERKKVFDITTTTTSLTGCSYTPNQVHVFHNGVRLVDGTDYTATDGSTVTLTTAAQSGDEVVVISYATFQTSDTVSASAGGTFTGDVTFSNNIVADGGTIKLDGNYPVGTDNVALGDAALDDASLSGGYNIAIGASALTVNTTGDNSVAIGASALQANTTGPRNIGIGRAALSLNTTNGDNTAVGHAALSNSTGSSNTALGSGSFQSNTTASNNTAVGYQAGYNNTTGGNLVATGHQTLYSNTTGNDNNAFGWQALYSNTTGSNNTSLGFRSLYFNTTASQNTAVGYQAGYNSVTSNNNTFIGYTAGRDITGNNNTMLGSQAGQLITSGTKNTVVGVFNGNQGGLDIRTGNNNIVLSDGDGNPRYYYYAGYHWLVNNRIRSQPTYDNTTGSAANINVDSNGIFNRSTSSLRYKNSVEDASHGLNELMTLRSVTYKGNNDGDTVFGGLIAEEVHDAGLTEFVQYDTEGRPDALAYGNMVSLCIKAIQEQQANIEALEARIATLESA